MASNRGLSSLLSSPGQLHVSSLVSLRAFSCRRRYRRSNSLNRRCLEVRASIFDTAWATTANPQDLAATLFASSIFPYAGFLYHLTCSKQAPGKTLFGFYFLLAFVGGTIPAGIYAKTHYGTTLANVDWLHGGAESLLTITNLFIVLGLREGLRDAKEKKRERESASSSPE